MPAEQRKRFGRSCDVGFALAAGFYCGLATLGYYFFGDCAADSLTLNLMSSSPLLGSMATGCVLLSTFSSISVLCVPVVRICTEAAACGDRKQMAERRRHEQSGGVGLWQPYERRTWAIKALLMIIAALLAVTVPNFGFLVSMMGAVTCMLISFILPVMCNIVVHRQQLSTLGLASNIAIVLLGVVGMAVGVQSTLERASLSVDDWLCYRYTLFLRGCIGIPKQVRLSDSSWTGRPTRDLNGRESELDWTQVKRD